MQPRANAALLQTLCDNYCEFLNGAYVFRLVVGLVWRLFAFFAHNVVSLGWMFVSIGN